MEKVHQGQVTFTLLLELKVRMVWNNYYSVIQFAFSDYRVIVYSCMETLLKDLPKKMTQTAVINISVENMHFMNVAFHVLVDIHRKLERALDDVFGI